MLLERDDALGQLTRALDRARHGEGSTVLVRGEAGIGKTTLLREWTRLIDVSGDAQVYWGSCEALFTPRPLGPVMDIAVSVGTLVRDAAGEQRPPSEIFAAVAAWLSTPAVSLRSRAGHARVTVLVFEDVHWADHLTLDFVKYIARRIHAWPALLVLSYRNDEVGPMHPLTQVLGELPTGATAAVDLRPLTAQAIQQLSGCDPREAGDLLRVTDGNPFFVTELVAAAREDPSLRNARSFVPVTVATAVLARAQHVGPAARSVLEVASLSPGSIDIGLLSALAGPGAHAGVDECVTAGLMQWTAQGFAFRHELARQAIENSLAPMRRRAMHARVYEQLRHDAQNVLDRMAYHAQHAHDAEAVLAIAPQAAAKAASLGAHREAAAHYRVALDHATGGSDELRADLLERWSYECTMTNEIDDDVLEARFAALRLRQRLGQTEKVGANQRWISRLLRLLARKAESEQWLDDAIVTLESVPPGAELAMAYSMRSAGYMLTNQCALAEHWGERAIELAKRHGAPDIEAHALNNVGSALVDDGQPRGFDLLGQSLAISLRHGLHEHAARAYVNACESAVRSRFLARVESLLAEGTDFVRDHDMDMYAPCLANSLAQLRLMQGRLDEADGAARRELRGHGKGAPVIHFPAEAVIATVSMLRDPAADGSALRALWPKVLALGEPDSIVPVALGLAESAWLRDDHDACITVVDEALAACANLSAWDRGELLCWSHRAGGETEPQAGVASPSQFELDGDFDAAAVEWASLSMPRHQAHVMLQAGLPSARHEAGRPESLSAAIATFDRVGATACAQHGRRLARKLASAGVKGIKTGPRAAARSNRFGLTPKELQIVSHLAHGLSNHEIAQRLSRSERTIEHHVSTVLAKLGARKRSDVPAILGEAGELDTLLDLTRR
jgi:DNA-binding CsgD family transcriptional regulator